MAEQKEISYDKAAVVIMDYQNRQLGYFSPEVQKGLLERANAVLAKARQKKLPVIHVEVVRGERTAETQMHPAIVVKPGEPVLTKRRTGPFTTTNLDEILKKNRVERLVLLGLVTSGCVLTTVRCAADMDYQLTVLSDCCADRDDEVQRVLMEKLFPRQASVITSQEFLRALG